MPVPRAFVIWRFHCRKQIKSATLLHFLPCFYPLEIFGFRRFCALLAPFQYFALFIFVSQSYLSRSCQSCQGPAVVLASQISGRKVHNHHVRNTSQPELLKRTFRVHSKFFTDAVRVFGKDPFVLTQVSVNLLPRGTDFALSLLLRVASSSLIGSFK